MKASTMRWRRIKLNVIAEKVQTCTRCALCESRTNAVAGVGPVGARIMIVGEAPGEEEDAQGVPFVGRSGKLLDHLLSKAGLSRERVFITNTVKCRPPMNREPAEKELDRCDRYLSKQIKIIKPRIIVAMGSTAFWHMTGLENRITEIRGDVIPSSRCRGIIGTFHPSFILRTPDKARVVVEDLRLAKRLALM